MFVDVQKSTMTCGAAKNQQGDDISSVNIFMDDESMKKFDKRPADENPGQQRKITIIERAFGPNWRADHPGMAIDAVYNLAIGDRRKSLFCKIDEDRKSRLLEMIAHYETTIGDVVGMMIDEYYDRYQKQRQNIVSGIAENFSGT